MNARIVLLCCLAMAFAATSTILAQERIAGEWDGAISLPGIDLGILVHFSGPNDALQATIDIPMQMAKGLPLTNVRAALPAVHFELPAGPGLAIFEGTVAGDSIAGNFRQGGVTARFRLHRKGEPKSVAPVPPPPYREEEVRVPKGDVTLAGTLSLPPKGGPFAAAILLTGSGAQNRDEELFGFRPFKILADHLTRNGYAVLRCDDRGVGGSTGNMSTSTTADFAQDALAMFRFLQARSDIERSRIGFIGHSEGAEVAAMSAVRSPDVAFVILLAGPALPGDTVILSQIAALGRLQGESEANIGHGLALERRVFTTVREQKGWDELRAVLLDEMRRSVDRLPADQKAAMTDSMLAARVDIQMQAIRTPWFAFFISHDPAQDLADIRCPLLALFGELDQQVSPSLNMQPMSSALSKGGNPDVTLITVSGVNHLFQKAVTGSPAEYAGLEKEFAAGVLDRLTAWLKKRFP
jgi:pimeloyl-ACP methyl ester carboxylesterase